jgi:acetyltransferase
MPDVPDLDPLFSPRAVAVVGATRTPGTVPNDLFRNLIDSDYQGIAYPVSPGAESIRGVRTHRYVVDIEGEVDLAVIVFPSSVAHLALEQCGEKGVKSCIIISAGFREVGGAGVEREERIREIATRHGIRVVGPNCLGAINTDPAVRLNASFARKMPDAGSIAFLSQSGALCTAVLDYARGRHIGFSKFISFGNKADIDEVDLIRYLARDEATSVILMYLEEIRDGRRLLEAAREVIRESGKPILAIKSGRTEAGASAAASHTGSLAGRDEVADAIFRQAGILRCGTIVEMFNRAIALADQPRPGGDGIAIITNAGGPGVMAADAVTDEGLALASFSDTTAAALRKALPKTANTKNPVDVIGDARSDRYRAALDATLADPAVRAALVILTPQSMTDIDAIADEVVRARTESADGKPVYASFMGEADVGPGVNALRHAGVPHYGLPEEMADACAAARRVARILERDDAPPPPVTDADPDRARAILTEAAAAGRTHLPEPEAAEVLRAYGLPVLPSRVATSADGAAASAGELGFPVAMKIVSPDIIHKSDAGGVILNVTDAGAARAAYERIVSQAREHTPDAEIRGVTVQPMAEEGTEIILGATRDAVFGPVLLLGLGGTFVEIFRDVAFRAAPLLARDADEMLAELRGRPLLEGARGRPPADVAALRDCLRRLSALAADCPEVKELDMNPVIVYPEGRGAVVADARILL